MGGPFQNNKSTRSSMSYHNRKRSIMPKIVGGFVGTLIAVLYLIFYILCLSILAAGTILSLRYVGVIN